MNAEFRRRSETDIKKLGLQDRGSVSISCPDCSSKLMVFQITKNNNDLIAEKLDPIETRVVVLCDICGSKSYVTTIEGQFYPGAPDNNMGFEPIELKDLHRCDVVFRAWLAKK